MIDTIIIGAGPAGVSAALYLRKLNHECMIIGHSKSQLVETDKIDNYYGVLPIAGPNLIELGIHQAKLLGIHVLIDSVMDIHPLEHGFEVITESSAFKAKTVVIATGKPRIPLKIPGFTTFRTKGVHMCVACDGFFYRRKSVALIGSGPYMEQELKTLENFTKDITIFTNGDTYHHDTYKVVTSPIQSFEGDDRVSHIVTLDGTYKIDGAFVALGFPSSNELALKLGIVQEKSNILVDSHMMTNIKGIFAGGDVIGGKLQIAKAVYDGLLISDGVHQYLKHLNT
jgi:thioredoxin reductase (NADPH)